MWKEDPARALGATLTNIVTAVIGTKGAGAGLRGGSAAARTGLAAVPRLADVRAALAAQLAKIPKIELPQLNPAFAGGGVPGRYQFDVERPAPDTGRMNSDAAPGAPGGGTAVPDRSVPPVGATDNGPGSWQPMNRNGWSAAAVEYQQQISGVRSYPDGSMPEYRVGGVDFDGLVDGVLVEAKGPGYANLLEQKFAPAIENRLVTQALSQVRAAGGTPLRWVFAEADAAAVVRELFEDADIADLIEVVVVPPAR